MAQVLCWVLDRTREIIPEERLGAFLDSQGFRPANVATIMQAATSARAVVRGDCADPVAAANHMARFILSSAAAAPGVAPAPEKLAAARQMVADAALGDTESYVEFIGLIEDMGARDIFFAARV